MEEQKMYSLIRQAVQEYNMIQEGDRIAVGISGGKDSLSLLVLMAGFMKFYPVKFEVMAITCDVGFEGMDFSEVSELCKSLGIKYEIVHTKISEIVFEKNSKERPCSLCAKLRKGAMYERLNELGYNKIAYAHNKDDFVETAVMSLIYEGRFYSFPPKTILEKSGITVIRPMMYIPEKSLEIYAKVKKLKIVKNMCPVDGSTKRQFSKNLVYNIGKDNKQVKDRIMHAIKAAELKDWIK